MKYKLRTEKNNKLRKRRKCFSAIWTQTTSFGSLTDRHPKRVRKWTMSRKTFAETFLVCRRIRTCRSSKISYGGNSTCTITRKTWATTSFLVLASSWPSVTNHLTKTTAFQWLRTRPRSMKLWCIPSLIAHRRIPLGIRRKADCSISKTLSLVMSIQQTTLSRPTCRPKGKVCLVRSTLWCLPVHSAKTAPKMATKFTRETCSLRATGSDHWTTLQKWRTKPSKWPWARNWPFKSLKLRETTSR